MNPATEITKTLQALLPFKDQTKLPEAWARVLNTPPYSADFYLGMSAIISKYDELEGAIQAADLDEVEARLYGRAATHLRQFIEPRTASQFSVAQLRDAQSYIDTVYLARRVLPEQLVPEVNKITLDTISQAISELLAMLGECVPPPDPKLERLLRANLATLMMAIASFDVLGANGVSRIFGTVAAEFTHFERTSPPTTETNSSLFKRAIAIVKQVGAAVVWCHATSSGAAGLLEEGSKISEAIEAVLPK
jgi:hypothetical protein